MICGPKSALLYNFALSILHCSMKVWSKVFCTMQTLPLQILPCKIMEKVSGTKKQQQLNKKERKKKGLLEFLKIILVSHFYFRIIYFKECYITKI